MNPLDRSIRSFAKLRFRLLNLATIKDITGEQFEQLLRQLVTEGWSLRSRYEGFDAGIEYDCVRLQKGSSALKCEWDNWSEWSIEGRRPIIVEIGKREGLAVSYAWRWSEHDTSSSSA